MPDPYVVLLAGFGAAVLLTAWLPMLLKELPLSLPIFCVALGAGLFGVSADGEAFSPQTQLAITERVTEFVVIVALMGAGLKLDRPLAWRVAAPTWRLLGLAMPLTILCIALLSVGVLGVGLAAALLLGAALAPTDPVLASDVQVGPPGGGRQDDVRFTLTAEAGLNDGLAFPFVHLAIAISVAGHATENLLVEWISIDVAWRLAAGGAVGFVAGRSLGWLTFRLPNRAKLARTGDGFVVLGITTIAYSLAEIAHGYGFVAVFVAAIAFRATERRHRYHEKLHDFVDGIERLLMMIVLVFFGGALVAGGLLEGMSWPVFVFAVVTLLVVRPVCAGISLLGRREPAPERAVMAFFGIRGIGTIYYLSFAFGRAPFEDVDVLWTAASLVILISIVLHGTAVTPVMRLLDRRASRPGRAACGTRSGDIAARQHGPERQKDH